MAKVKEGEGTILFQGKFYQEGEELPSDYGKYPSKRTRPEDYAGAAPAAVNQPDQTNRPGMSGSGAKQEGDIVNKRGHVTHPEGDHTQLTGESEREPGEGEEPKMHLGSVDAALREELPKEEKKGKK